MQEVKLMYSQNDSRWNEIPLGTSTKSTIGSSGCKLCCFAEILNKWGYTHTPRTLNTLYFNRFYSNGCNIADESMKEAFSWIEVKKHECEHIPADLSLLEKTGNEEIILRLSRPSGSHFVLLDHMEGEYPYIQDPLTGDTCNLEDEYGDARTVITKITKYRNPLYNIPILIAMENKNYGGYLIKKGDEYKTYVELKPIAYAFGCDIMFKQKHVVVAAPLLSAVQMFKIAIQNMKGGI